MDWESHAQLADVREYSAAKRDPRFSPDGVRLIRAGWDGRAIIQNTRTWRPQNS